MSEREQAQGSLLKDERPPGERLCHLHCPLMEVKVKLQLIHQLTAEA